MISKPLSPSLSAVIPAELCGHLSTFTGKLRGRDHHFVQTAFDCPDGQRGGRLLADCGVDQLGKNASVLFTTAPEMFGLLVGGSDAVDHVLHAWEAGDLAGTIRALARWQLEARTLIQAIEGEIE